MTARTLPHSALPILTGAGWSRLILAGLLAACLAKGLLFSTGLTVPPDADIVRDLGFIQGILDGNLFGDPAHQGAWRWYPPLIHAMAAAIARVTGADVMPLWLLIGPWLNLLAPLTFHLMAERLMGRWPACIATTVFVLFNSAVMNGDEAAGYTPWPLTPGLTWPIFFASVSLIHARAGSTRFVDALLIGSALGIAFLAHTVPAILLSAIVTVVALRASAPRARVVAWLAVVALVELAWAAPFLGPLVLDYRLHIANPVPGTWVHTLLGHDGLPHLIAVNLPGVLAMGVVLIRHPRPVWSGATRAIVATWTVTCLAFLARHFTCSALEETGGTCGVFVIAAHHYHVYLQAAWALAIGQALWLLAEALPRRDRRALLAAPAGLATLAGFCLLAANPRDREMRTGTVEHPETVLDRQAYAWILRNTAPTDVFVTTLPAATDQMGPSAATVIAAGRHLVAPPAIHANPYLIWPPMNRARLTWLHGFETGNAAELCAFSRATGPDRGAYFLLTADTARSPIVKPHFRSAGHTVWQVDAAACG